MRYILERLNEATTWGGIFVFLSNVLKIDLNAAWQAQWTTVGMAVAGLILMAMPNTASIVKVPKQ